MIKKSISILLLTMLVAGVSCGKKRGEISTDEKTVAVTVDVAARRNLVIKNIYTGTLEGVKQAQIIASIPEAVVDLPISEGSQVKAGQAVIYLDKNGAYSQYKQAKAVFVDASDNFQKMTNLFEQGAVSEQAFNSTKMAYDVASANFASAKHQVELTTPIDGILTDLSVNLGEYVPVGSPLATVAQTDKMRMTLFVDAASARNIKIGEMAEINLDINSGEISSYSGKVTEVSKSADPDTRLFRVELRVDNSRGEIRPGTFARAKLNVANLESVLTIPQESMFLVEGIQKVYLLKGDRASERTIAAGESSGDYVQVLSGLTDRDTVIVIGRNLVSDSTKVKVITNGEEGAGTVYSEAGTEG